MVFALNGSVNHLVVCDVNGSNVIVNGTLTSINGTVPTACALFTPTKTYYGYYPNLAANVVGAVLFFLVLAAQVIQGLWTQEWWMFVSWGITAALEMITYIGRSIGHDLPKSLPMFEMQLVCSIIGPAFMAAGLYYQLGKIVTLYGEKYSMMPPMIYCAIFTTCDVISLVIQGVGGGIAASNVQSPYGPGQGGWIMVAGIAFQVLVLSIFIILWIQVNWKILRDDPANWDPIFAPNRERVLYKWLLPAICVSILFLEIRSIYRIIELAVGWSGYIMETERYFLIVDGLMVLIGMVPLCITYPGFAYGYVPIRGLNYKVNDPFPLEKVLASQGRADEINDPKWASYGLPDGTSEGSGNMGYSFAKDSEFTTPPGSPRA